MKQKKSLLQIITILLLLTSISCSFPQNHTPLLNKKCGNHCTNCIEGICKSCETSFYPLKSFCFPCPSGCHSCISNSLCSTCNEGYVLKKVKSSSENKELCVVDWFSVRMMIIVAIGFILFFGLSISVCMCLKKLKGNADDYKKQRSFDIMKSSEQQREVQGKQAQTNVQMKMEPAYVLNSITEESSYQETPFGSGWSTKKKQKTEKKTVKSGYLTDQRRRDLVIEETPEIVHSEEDPKKQSEPRRNSNMSKVSKIASSKTIYESVIHSKVDSSIFDQGGDDPKDSIFVDFSVPDHRAISSRGEGNTTHLSFVTAREGDDIFDSADEGNSAISGDVDFD